MNYQQKYLKYKSKYLYLKNQQEGGTLAADAAKVVITLAPPQVKLVAAAGSIVAKHLPLAEAAKAAKAAAEAALAAKAPAAAKGILAATAAKGILAAAAGAKSH